MKTFWLFRSNIRNLEYYHQYTNLDEFEKNCHDFYMLLPIWLLRNNYFDEVMLDKHVIVSPFPASLFTIFRPIFLSLERLSNSPATEIRIALNTNKFPTKAPIKAVTPASQKFCRGERISRTAIDGPVVKP